MFSGIIEGTGRIAEIIHEGSNQIMWISSPFEESLQVDQSLSHNGVCLTVEEVNNHGYRATAVKETLEKTALGQLQVESLINLERSLTLGSYVDGHLVQGHVDNIATCVERKEVDGSWLFQFRFNSNYNHLLVEKGSITINGVSLTAFDVTNEHFTVTIIPHTFNNTNFFTLKPGDSVNLEFDLIGKYVQKQLNTYQQHSQLSN